MSEYRKTTGVLLAAGASIRYGAEDKLLAPFRGEPLLLHAARTLRTLPLGRHIAVVRDRNSQVADQPARAGFEIVLNADTHLGPSTSLGTAARAAVGQESMLVCLADMPKVGVGHLDAILAALGPESIAASSAGSCGPCPPAAFTARHFRQAAHLSGDAGARALLQTAAIVAAPSSELIDLDTAADFRREAGDRALKGERWPGRCRTFSGRSMIDRQFGRNIFWRRNVGWQRRWGRIACRCLSRDRALKRI